MSDPFAPVQLERRARRHQDASMFDVEFSIMEARIQKLIEDNAFGAALSDIGRIHLQKYSFLIPRSLLVYIASKWGFSDISFLGEEFPRLFGLKDVMLHADDMTAQLMAEEYVEDAGELTPYTLDALDQYIHGRIAPPDPFETNYRPNCTVEAVHPDGRKEVVNINPDKPITEKPEQGFRELNG